MPAIKLKKKEISTKLGRLKGWNVKGGSLHRVFEFADFVHAFAFMSAVALEAQAMNHHPDWSNSWNKVSIDLVTHSAGGITPNDFDLATKIQKLFNG